jgi:hypothetical protein
MLTSTNIADISRSATAGVTPTTTPRVAAVGNAEVTWLPGGDQLAVTMDVGAHMVVTNESAARDLYACLAKVFDPLAETRRAAERVAAL